jgi:lipopolysaccharide export system protein LptA
MPLPVTRLRRWLALGAIAMIAIVAGMYFSAQWRLRRIVHEAPAKIGLDIQQTAEGFSISKSLEGRTLFTVSASKAVQFKQGGRAELHNVKIVVYGKDSSRFDRISGDDFEFDPKSGDVTAKGKVLIDLEANPEGGHSADQSPPKQSRNPIHLETEGFLFNKNSGDASASGRVVFTTPEASGSAMGVEYASRSGTLTLRSAVEMEVTRPEPFRLSARRGVIAKAPREVVLSAVHMTRPQQQLTAGRARLMLREDDTVERIIAEDDVESELHGRTTVHARSDRAELMLSGTRNQITSAVFAGTVHLVSEGKQPAEAGAGKVTLHFGPGQVLETVHAEENVRLAQKQTAPGGPPPAAVSTNAQEVEMTAPAMDFTVKDGRTIELAETSGPPAITIWQPSSRQKTVVAAGRFTAKFTANNHLASLHGEPDARIDSSAPGQPDRISTSPTLDVLFQEHGGISTITQSGGLVYASGTQKAWAQRGVYTAADQMLVLNGSPRVVDGGLTTTAQLIRFQRSTGDATAEGNVKSTYSDLKPQPEGGMFSSSDPIHVVSRSMTAHRSPAAAVYSGQARLWQNSNVVEAPTLQFDRERRSLVAEGTASQPVKTVLVQVDKNGKATPATITSAHLTYRDAERQVLAEGGVTVKSADATMTAGQMTVYLAARVSPAGSAGQKAPESGPRGSTPSPSYPGQVERIVAEGKVVIVQPTRRALGEHLVYTALDEKFVLTGGSPSIFDAERGKITGDSLTFYRHDDRVLVEGRETSPAVTRTEVAR